MRISVHALLGLRAILVSDAIRLERWLTANVTVLMELLDPSVSHAPLQMCGICTHPNAAVLLESSVLNAIALVLMARSWLVASALPNALLVQT